LSRPGTFTSYVVTEWQGTSSERNDHRSRMFPLTPALSLKGEGVVRTGIVLWGSLPRMEEG